MNEETSASEPSHAETGPEAGRARGRSERVAILIAGMHRSGTSALARVLSLLGCDLPNTLLPAGPANEPGHWESFPIMALNDEALASAGSTWDDWEAFNPSWDTSPAKEEFFERALITLESEFGASRMFVLKDPRICRLLRFWIEAVTAFGALPVIVSPIRNPLEVAASLEKRDGIDPSIGQLLWLRHVLEAEKDSRGLTRAFIRYDQLLAGAQVHTLTQRLGKELQLSWPRRSTAVDIEIEQFLSPGYRHNVEEDASVLGNPTLSSWIRSSFDILDHWACGEICDAGSTELDCIRAAFDQATPAFARPVLVGRQAVHRKLALEAELAVARERFSNLESTLAAREAELAESNARLGNLEGVLTTRDTELAESKARLGNLEGVLATRDTELAESKTRLGNLESALATRDTELAESKARLGNLEGALATRDTELAESKARLGNLRS